MPLEFLDDDLVLLGGGPFAAEFRDMTFRLPNLYSMVSEIRDCADAARLTNEIPASLARRNRLPFVRDESLHVLSEITDHLWKKLSCLNSATEWALIVVEQDIQAPGLAAIDGAARGLVAADLAGRGSPCRVTDHDRS